MSLFAILVSVAWVTSHTKEQVTLRWPGFSQSSILLSVANFSQHISILNIFNFRLCQHQFLLGGGNAAKSVLHTYFLSDLEKVQMKPVCVLSPMLD